MSGARVQTVLGAVGPASLGVALPHEHVLISAIGTGPPEKQASMWDEPITLTNLYEVRRRPDLCRAALSLDDLDEQAHELARFREAGGGCIVDVTPPDLGRSPAGLVTLAQRTGLAIVMGCGHFMRGFHPAGLAAMDEEELCAEMVGDVVKGFDGVRAGIIGEIGLSLPHHPDEERVLRAGARASAATGAALTIHPGADPSSCHRALDLVAAAGGDVTRTVIGHVERTLRTLDEYVALARSGCWLEFDLFGHEAAYHRTGVVMPNDATRIERMREIAELGFADRLLVSHDVAYRTDLRAYGGPGYAHLLTSVVPMMRAASMPVELVERVLIANPAAMLSIA